MQIPSWFYIKHICTEHKASRGNLFPADWCGLPHPQGMWLPSSLAIACRYKSCVSSKGVLSGGNSCRH